MKFSDIAVKHSNKFKYNISKRIAYLEPHYIFNIEDCVHYRCLVSDNFNDYKMLLNVTDQPEHSLIKFKTLICEFDIKKMEPVIVSFNPKIKKYLVEDGCHRLSIMLYKKIFDHDIPDQYINIK